MTAFLVFFVADPVDDALAGEVRACVRELGQARTWADRTPGFFDDPGAGDGDERTTGGYLRVEGAIARADAESIFEAALALSEALDVAVEMQWREEILGRIESGIAPGELIDRMAGVAAAVSVSAILPVARPVAWAALVDREQRAAWWPHLVHLEAAAGGRFEERWGDGNREIVTSGEVVEAVPPRRLELAWRDEDWPAATRVRVELRAHPEGTEARIEHDGWEALPGGADLAAVHERGWRMHLGNWARALRED